MYAIYTFESTSEDHTFRRSIHGESLSLSLISFPSSVWTLETHTHDTSSASLGFLPSAEKEHMPTSFHDTTSQVHVYTAPHNDAQFTIPL